MLWKAFTNSETPSLQLRSVKIKNMRKPLVLFSVIVVASVGTFIIACGGMAKTNVSKNDKIHIAMKSKKAIKVEFKSDRP
mgnify:CR=1 FL=1